MGAGRKAAMAINRMLSEKAHTSTARNQGG